MPSSSCREMPVRLRRQLAVTAPLAVLALLTACGPHPGAAAPGPASGIAPGWALAGGARVSEGAQAMVVTGSSLASDVGRDILRRGGNAVDAAVAVGFALAVVHPEAGNLGGGGFMVVRLRDGTVRSPRLPGDRAGPAPPATCTSTPRGEPTELSITGPLAAGVPGAVAGLTEAHRRYGRLPFAAVIEPAIGLARDGFLVDEYRSRSIAGDSARLALFPASRASFLPDGAPPAPGTRCASPTWRATLDAIRDHGADGFYRGRVADLIVAEMERGGGLISHEDLAALPGDLAGADHHQLPRATPSTRCRPPPRAGSRWARSSTSWKATIRCRRSARPRWCTSRRRPCGGRSPTATAIWATRPSCGTRTDRLLSKDVCRRPAAGDRRPRHADARVRSPAARAGGSTTHYSVVDAEGNAVSCTTTLNDSYGSAVTVTRRGLPAQRRDGRLRHGAGKTQHVRPGPGRGQRDRAGQAHALGDDAEHRARPREAACSWCVGTPGGPRIITMVYHVISNVIDHRMPLPEAVAAPRMHHQGLPGHPAGRARGLPTRHARQPPPARPRDRDRGLLGRRGGDHPDGRTDGRA